MADATSEMIAATMSGAVPIDLTGMADFHAASDFLRSVFNGQERGVLPLFCKPSNVSHFASLDRDGWYDDAADTAMRLRDHFNIYFAMGLQADRPDKGRGKEAGVISLPGLWADIDVLGPNHAALALPPTIEDAMRIVQAVPFKPTVIVYTGGGIQAYWLFREAWEFDTDKERKKAKALSKAFQKYLQNAAITCGWIMDGTADLCRVLRLPGTYNRKQAEPVLVRYEVVADARRYNSSDFQDFLNIEADPELKAHLQGPAPEQPSAEFLRVLAGCTWIRHCKDDAASLSEPEWYRMLSIVGRCKDGIHLAHELSRPYAKYSESETAEKLKQAMGAAGPATCAFIGGDLGCGRYCVECNHRGKITSPVVLGIPKRSKRGKDEATDGGRPRRSGLPNIQANDRQLREVTGESLAALQAFNIPPSIFARAGRPVCIHKEENGRHTIIEVTDRILRNRLTRAADFYEIIADGFTNCAPPMDMVKDILAMPPTEWGFAVLQGIIEAPALRDDGTIIMTPGYDEQSRLFYAEQDGLNMPELVEQPTADHIEVAVEMVHDVLSDFPFVDAASRTNAIAAILTPVVRPAIKGATPLALFDATTQGTGKTLLVANGQYAFYVWLKVPSGTMTVSLGILDNGWTTWLVGPTAVTVTTSWQRFKVTGTMTGGATSLWVAIGHYTDGWTSGLSFHAWGACLQQGNDPKKGYAGTWGYQASPVTAGVACGAMLVVAKDSSETPFRVAGPGSNLADHTLLQVNSAGELTIAGGTGNGYMLSALQGASNPSGWSGVIRVKNPAGVTAGYILLYSNP